MSLFDYLQDVQRLLRDTKSEMVNPDSLIAYVNKARREVALRTQCVRVLTPFSGTIISASVVAGGAGYTNPTVSVSPPDFPGGAAPYPNGAQATALATLGDGGAIAGVQIQFGGSGYWAPTATIDDLTGEGVSVVLTVKGAHSLAPGQERYDFKDIDTSVYPGVGPVYMVRGVSILYSNYRYSLPCYSLTTYQAFIRKYPTQYMYVPCVFTQVGAGSAGYILAYPLPAQAYPIEFDCCCMPRDLTTDQDYDAIPDPWRDVVKDYALFLAYSELQAFNNARAYYEKFDREIRVCSQAARPGRATNPIGRW